MTSWTELIGKLQALIVAFDEDLADTCRESSDQPTALLSDKASIEYTSTASVHPLTEQLDSHDAGGPCEMDESRSDQFKSPDRPSVPACQDRTTLAAEMPLSHLQPPLKSKPACQLQKKHKYENNEFTACKEGRKEGESVTELAGREMYNMNDSLQPKKSKSNRQFRKKYKYVNKKFIKCKEPEKEHESDTELVCKEIRNMVNDPFEYVGTQLTPVVNKAEADDGKRCDCRMQFELFEDTSVDESTDVQQNQISSDASQYREAVADIVAPSSNLHQDKISAKELKFASNAVFDVEKFKSKSNDLGDHRTAVHQKKRRREQQRTVKEKGLKREYRSKQVAEDMDDGTTMQMELFEEMSVDKQQPATTGDWRHTAVGQRPRHEQQQARMKEKGLKQENDLKQLVEDIADAEMYDLIISQRCLTKLQATDVVPCISLALTDTATEPIAIFPRDNIANDAAGCPDLTTNDTIAKSDNEGWTTDAISCRTLSDSDSKECDDTQVYDPLLLGYDPPSDRPITGEVMPYAVHGDTATDLTTSSSRDDIANFAAAFDREPQKWHKSIDRKFITCEDTGQEDESSTESVGKEMRNANDPFESGCQSQQNYGCVNIVHEGNENNESDAEIVADLMTAAVESSREVEAAVICILSDTAVINADSLQLSNSCGKDLTIVHTTDNITVEDVEANEEANFDGSLKQQQHSSTKNVEPVSDVAICDPSLQSDDNIRRQFVVDVSPSETLHYDASNGRHTKTVSLHGEPSTYVVGCVRTGMKRLSRKRQRKTEMKRCKKMNKSYDTVGLKRMRSQAAQLIISDVEDYSSGQFPQQIFNDFVSHSDFLS